MKTIECNGINSVVSKAANLLLSTSIKRKVHGHICWEHPEPVCFKLVNPTSRWVTIPERKWNVHLAYAESLWIASGRNDLSMICHYLKKMAEFSDDGITMRGAYGPRIRAFNNNKNDYHIEEFANTILNKISNVPVDQLQFIEKCFLDDEYTRKAVIQIGDPIKDCFDNHGEKKRTKDLPCTRTLHFMKDASTNKLNLIVHMRSNDFLWGTTAVDIFNFTFMHEYMSLVLGMEIGCYYHIVDNFHYYNNFKSKIKLLSKIPSVEDPFFKYNCIYSNLSEFNRSIKKLCQWEEKLRNDSTSDLISFKNDFFDDWAKVLFVFNTKSTVDFVNPILNRLPHMKIHE